MKKLILGIGALAAGVWFLFFREKEAKAATVTTSPLPKATTGSPVENAQKSMVSTEESSTSLREAEGKELIAAAAVERLDTKKTSYSFKKYAGDSREELAILIKENLESHPKKGTEDKAAIAAFQNAVGITADGLYGKNTALALATYLPSGKAPPARYGV